MFSFSNKIKVENLQLFPYYTHGKSEIKICKKISELKVSDDVFEIRYLVLSSGDILVKRIQEIENRGELFINDNHEDGYRLMEKVSITDFSTYFTKNKYTEEELRKIEEKINLEKM